MIVSQWFSAGTKCQDAYHWGQCLPDPGAAGGLAQGSDQQLTAEEWHKERMF